MQKTRKKKHQKINLKDGNFTITHNSILQARNEGKKISLEAKGLYLEMKSLPSDWDFTVRGLSIYTETSKDKISRLLNELEKVNLIQREQQRTIKGNINRFGKIKYIIIEKYTNDDASNNTQCPEKQDTANQPQTNNLNKQSNNDKLKDKGLLDKPRDYKINNHYYTNHLITKKIIDLLDYDIENYNQFFIELDKQYKTKNDKELIKKVMRYVRDNLLKDKKYKSLSNKFSYLKASIINNIEEEERKRKRPPQKYIDFLKELEQFKAVNEE